MKISEQELKLREKQINDSAKTIRDILINVATTIGQTEKVATDSSQALDNARETVDRVAIPENLPQAQSIVLQMIDRVISSNQNLKKELSASQKTLTEQKKQIENLQAAVRIDALTKLANRAYFDEKLTESLRILRRYNDPFCLMMIDLDQFKSINDTHGHPGGDRILKEITAKIRESIRNSDFVARIGGDEFALILIKVDDKTALEVAQKLCDNIRKIPFQLDGTSVSVTLSIGAAAACIDDTEESIMKRADEALYQVKKMGRDNFMMAPKPSGNKTDDVRQFHKRSL